MKLPLKGSSEYKLLVSLTGLVIGLVWVAKDEYENPKWTGVPKAAPMPISEYDTWNKQFGPTDPSKWAMTVAQRELVEEKMALKPEEAIIRTKTPTWE